jgi:transcriptional regulator with XRE-family HTH domain
LDLPQSAIAARCGLSARIVCQAERGSVDSLLSTLAKLALAVGLEVPAMLKRTDPGGGTGISAYGRPVPARW